METPAGDALMEVLIAAGCDDVWLTSSGDVYEVGGLRCRDASYLADLIRLGLRVRRRIRTGSGLGPANQAFRRRLTSVTAETVWRLHDEGLTQAELAEKFGVTRQRINQVLHMHPGYRARRAAEAERRAQLECEDEQIRSVVAAGELNPTVISERLGFPVQRVAKVMRQAGFSPGYPRLPSAVDGLLPVGDHRHGRAVGYNAGCRCSECSEASRRRLAQAASSRRERGLPADSPIHGTLSGYGNWRCRCDPCKAAHAALHRRRKAEGLPKGDPKHGTENGYSNWSCRCDRCKAAAAAADRRRKERRT